MNRTPQQPIRSKKSRRFQTQKSSAISRSWHRRTRSSDKTRTAYQGYSCAPAAAVERRYARQPLRAERVSGEVGVFGAQAAHQFARLAMESLRHTRMAGGTPCGGCTRAPCGAPRAPRRSTLCATRTRFTLSPICIFLFTANFRLQVPARPRPLIAADLARLPRSEEPRLNSSH